MVRHYVPFHPYSLNSERHQNAARTELATVRHDLAFTPTPRRGRNTLNPTPPTSRRRGPLFGTPMSYGKSRRRVARSTRRVSKRKGRSSRGSTGKTALYGSTFTSKVAYRKKGPNKSRVRAGKSKSRKFLWQSMKLQQPQNSIGSNFFTISSTAGLQGMGSIDILNGQDVENLVLGQLPASPTRLQLRDFELYMKQYRFRTTLINNSTNPAIIDIYDIVPRRDVPYTDMYSPTTNNGNILSSWIATNTTSGADIGSDTKGDAVPGWNSVGFTPFQYPNFCRQFKILKVRTTVLQADDHYVDTDTVGMRSMNLEKWMNPTTVTAGLKNWYLAGTSRQRLFMVRGLSDGSSLAPAVGITVQWECQCVTKVIQVKASSANAILNA